MTVLTRQTIKNDQQTKKAHFVVVVVVVAAVAVAVVVVVVDAQCHNRQSFLVNIENF